MSLLARLQNSRNGLGIAFMLPAAVLLLLFLTYPLGLGVWLGFTDAELDALFEGVVVELADEAIKASNKGARING